MTKITAYVTPYEGDAPGPRDWREYVAERLVENYPEAEVEVVWGGTNKIFVDGEPEDDADVTLGRWWDELCRDSEHEQWKPQ